MAESQPHESYTFSGDDRRYPVVFKGSRHKPSDVVTVDAVVNPEVSALCFAAVFIWELVGRLAADDDVEPDHAKNPKHAKHNHGMVVMDTKVSFCANPEDPETIMEVDDITFMDWSILDPYSASKEAAQLSIDVEMSDYVDTS